MVKKFNMHEILIVISCFLMMFFIFATCVSCMGIYVTPVAEDFGISKTTFSMTITIGSLAMLVSAVLAGKLMGKFNIKILMLIGVLMCGGAFFIYSIAPSIIYFYAAAILMGCSVSLTCNIPVAILIKDWFSGKNEGLALGIAYVGSGAGTMIMTPVYSYIIETIGWRASYRFAAIIIAAVLIPLVLFVIKRHGDHKASTTEAIIDPSMISLSDVLKKPCTWFVFTGFVIISLSNMAILSQGIPYLIVKGFESADAAKIISLASGALIIGKIILGKLIDTIGSKKATLISSVCLMICILSMWCTGLVANTGTIIVFVVSYAIGASSATVSIPSIISYMFGKCDFGSILGFFSMAGGAGGMLQIIVSGIADATGNYNYAWATVVALSLIMIIIMVIFVKPQHKADSLPDGESL